MSGDPAAAVMRGLAEAGADLVWGMPGGGSLAKIRAGREAGMRFALTHGETAACAAAAVYGRLTDTPGAAMVTLGPGVASAVNGLACATLDRLPLVLLSETVPAANRGWAAHQRLDQIALTGPVAKWSGTVGRDQPQAVAAAAGRLARAAPMGAVHLDCDPSAPGDPPPPLPPPAAPDPEALRAARKLAAGAARPVFLVGAEAVPGAERVRALVEGLGAPALVSYQAKGVIPDHSPCYGGVFTNSSLERALVEEADIIVVLGLDAVEPLSRPWAYRAPILRWHPFADRHRFFPSSVEVTGPLEAALDGLAGAWRSEWAPGAGAEHNRRGLEAVRADGPGFTPFALLEAVLEASPPDSLLTVDAGAHFLVVMPFAPARRPLDILISNGLATMGFALPAALGAAMASPGRPVTAMTGDGGLGMVLAELETLARLRLPVTVVVWNDSALSLIGLKGDGSQDDAPAVRYQPVDYAAAARALGVPGFTVANGEEARRALSAPSGGGPRLIDARIDPGVYSHVIGALRG